MTRCREPDVVGWPAELAERYRREGYWAGRTLTDLLAETARARPEATAVVDGRTRLTYADLWRRADALAVHLERTGIGRGDRVVVQLPNRVEFVVLLLALLRLGAVPVMALPAHRHRELSHLVGHAEAVALAVPAEHRDFDHLALARRIRSEQPGLTHLLVCGPGGDLDLSAVPPTDDVPAGAGPTASDVAVFLLSGGTTGLPKLIPRTHDDYAYNAAASAELCRVDADTVYLACLPAGHNFPLACPGLLGTLLRGGRVVLTDSPAPVRAFATIAAEGVTHTAVVPAVAARWLEHAAEVGAGQLATLRVLQVGGARMPDELARRVRPTMGVALQQVFGMAEGLLNYTRLDDPPAVVHTTQGRPLSLADEVAIVDEQGAPVPDGTPGLLLTRGPYTLRGYYRAAEHNARAFTADGWYRTGDVCRRTPEGNLVVEGRDKDMINRAGEKISAEAVEDMALALSGVRLAAAVAMPDAVVGERVALFVVLAAGRRLDLAEVREAMTEVGAATFALPEALFVRPDLPLTPVGKIDKKALRAVAAAPTPS